jgi:hypothetical protein
MNPAKNGATFETKLPDVNLPSERTDWIQMRGTRPDSFCKKYNGYAVWSILLRVAEREKCRRFCYNGCVKLRIYIESTGTTLSTFAEDIRCSRSGLRKRCCEMSSVKKQFDAVEMMRSIRDRLSAQIQGMTLEEERAWLASQEFTDPFLRRIRDKIARQDAAAAGAAPHR